MDIKKIEEIANKLWLKNPNFSKEDEDKIVVDKIDDGIYGSYVKTDKRGLGYFIIGEDGSYLFGSSALSRNQILDEYKNGRRSN